VACQKIIYFRKNVLLLFALKYSENIFVRKNVLLLFALKYSENIFAQYF